MTVKRQILMPLQGNIRSKGNHYNLLNDWRYEKYPQDTYGLGGRTIALDYGFGLNGSRGIFANLGEVF